MNEYLILYTGVFAGGKYDVIIHAESKTDAISKFELGFKNRLSIVPTVNQIFRLDKDQS